MDYPSLYEALCYRAYRIRLVEEAIAALYPTDRIQSPIHLSLGQEAVAVGVCRALQRTDLLFCTYRSHAYYLAKGGDLRIMFAELFGKATGCGGGKAGSMHLSCPDEGMLVASAIVASAIPHATGAALAAKVRNTQQIIVAAFGDGATEEGVFHESMNFAALRALPILFLCKNNGQAIHAAQQSRQAFRLQPLSKAYGIATTQCDAGYHPHEVFLAAQNAIAGIRATGKPALLEVMTCRYAEHVGPALLRTDATERWKENDPLTRPDQTLQKYRAAIEEEIAAAIAFAESSPEPQAEALFTDVF